nr:restriction endonuclease subunit S [Tenacibaculum maritimum]
MAYRDVASSASATERSTSATEESPSATENKNVLLDNTVASSPSATEESASATENKNVLTDNTVASSPSATEESPSATERSASASENKNVLLDNTVASSPSATEESASASERSASASENKNVLLDNTVASSPSATERSTSATESPSATENKNVLPEELEVLPEELEGKEQIPKLRFKEFNENYKRYSFKDTFIFSTGKNIKQKEASPEFETPCVRYGELYHMYNEVIHQIINNTNLEKSELLFSKGDEILLPSAGEAPLDIGSASALTVKDVAIGRTINILRPLKKNIYSSIYVSYYINQKLRKKISTLAKGSSISNVYNSDLKKLEIKLPQLQEQQKIASFLSSVDKKIELLQKKKALIEQYKKGVMQKIFSQELRFKPDLSKVEGDDGESNYPDWEEKKLGEVLSIGSGKDYKHLSKGNIPVFGTGGIMTFVDDFLFDGDSVGIGRKGTIDKPVYLKGKFWTVDTLFYTHSFIKVLPKFIYFNFLRINWKKYNEASGVPSLSKATIENIYISIPSIEEQTKIANFLSAIDAKIELIDTQLENTIAFKKGLLQQMFV